MRLLLFSDLHCDTRAAQKLVDLVSEQRADIIVGAGDFANLRRNLNATIDVLQSLSLPAVLVPGNAESHAELMAACKCWPTAHVLHGQPTSVAGTDFFGIGGAVPVTPFGSWSYDFSEEEATQLLADCPAGCVLVSHSPPKGCLDMASSGDHLGSTAVRKAIERCTPRLVVCGHIHGCSGQTAMMGRTAVVNAGPAGVIFEI